MMRTYFGGEDEALDGFEFLSMAEAAELCHWEIVERMSDTIGATDVHDLATWAVEAQREHVETVRRASLPLAVQEITESANGRRTTLGSSTARLPEVLAEHEG